ncbi:MAG: hypothetical protein IMW89_17460 [Ktedonobacteraceae bacterium]|nr:hypothetical protein [Ktedonobacteraceae bacterium]
MPVTTTMPANTVTSVFAIGLFEGQPKAGLVVAQVKGIPGLPNTGSDPNALPKDTSTALIPWLLAACSLVFFALSFISHRFTVVQEG